MKVKKLLCLALAAALTCPGLPTQAAQTQATSTAAQSERAISPANALADTDEFQFDVLGRLIKYTGEGGDVVIPDGVTGIRYAFTNCTSLTSVSIPKSVTYIGDGAFLGCSNLASVDIPESVTYIGSSAFGGTKWLEKNQLLIANHILFDANPELCQGELTIPEDVTYIGDGAFLGCSNLTTVTIPEGVISIGMSAFKGCTSLANISIPKGVTEIGNNAFYGCTNLNAVTIPEGVTYIGNNAFYGCTSLTSIYIPDSVDQIWEFAFGNCTNLSSINIPKNITLISDGIFYGCTNLANISIPDNLNLDFVGFDVCHGTKWLKEHQFFILNHTIYGADPTSCIGNLTIPNGVTSIESSGFSGFDSLTGISIPESVTYIQCSTFSNCANLANVSISGNVTLIGDSAFSDCTSLANISISGNVSNIDSFAFSSCSNLANVSITGSVTNIDYYAFSGCTGLTSISFPEGLSSIHEGSFYGCSNLSNVSLPEGLSSIGPEAFQRCSSLDSITIPKSVSSIGEKAFGYILDKDYNAIPKPGFLIRGYAGTAAETYAKENGFEFLELQEETPAPPAEVTPTPIVQPTPPAEVTPTPIVQPTPPAEVTPTPIVQPTPPAEVTPPVEPTPPAEVTPNPEPEKADIANATVALPQSAYTYTGKPLSPPITVTYGGKALSLGKDYAAVYTDNINAGTAKVTLTGAGGYQGSITKTFTISKAGQPISGTKSYQKPYGGKPFLLDAARTAGDGALSYSSSAPKVASVSQKGKITIKGTGAATITVTAKETANYAPQTFQVEVRVSPKKPTLSTLKPKGGRRLAISWKKDMRATGYEVWCSTSKSFKKGLKKAKIKGNKVTSCQFSKLKAGKKYYVRLRSYKTVKANGKTIVLRSKWSSVKQSKKIRV